MRVRFTARAEGDLTAILDYLRERSPIGARNVERSIRKTIELVGDFPSSGQRAGEQNVRVLRAGKYPYLVYWDVRSGEAWIVHIRHASRRPPDEQQREL